MLKFLIELALVILLIIALVKIPILVFVFFIAILAMNAISEWKKNKFAVIADIIGIIFFIWLMTIIA